MSSQPASIELLLVLVSGTLMLLSGLGKRRLEWRPKLHWRRRLVRRPAKLASSEREAEHESR